MDDQWDYYRLHWDLDSSLGSRGSCDAPEPATATASTARTVQGRLDLLKSRVWAKIAAVAVGAADVEIAAAGASAVDSYVAAEVKESILCLRLQLHIPVPVLDPAPVARHIGLGCKRIVPAVQDRKGKNG